MSYSHVAYVEAWKEILGTFLRVKSFVVFGHGSVVVFSESQGDYELTVSKAVDIMEDAINIEDKKVENSTVLRMKGIIIIC